MATRSCAILYRRSTPATGRATPAARGVEPSPAKLRRERDRHSDALHELLDHPRRLIISIHQTIDELLPVLRTRADHMAVVVDEFGSTAGMITMEDVLEEVVGEIDVGHDFDEYLPRRRRVYEMLGEGVYLMDSRLPVSEVNDALDIDLPMKESHTIGGLVMTRLRRIPVQGESIVESGYRFTVEEASERTVLKLRVAPVGAGAMSPGRADGRAD